MTPEQKTKAPIMLGCLQFMAWRDNAPINEANVDDAWQSFRDEDCDADGPSPWCAQDAISEFRSGLRNTEIEPPYSRHYEARSVAAKMFDGSYVGWTYFYGGGKYGDPESIDWMSDAYDLDHKAEEKLVTVHTFTKK
jgi:hypothetical protein